MRIVLSDRRFKGFRWCPQPAGITYAKANRSAGSLNGPVVMTPAETLLFSVWELRENRRRLRHCDGLQAPPSHCVKTREGRSEI